MIETLWGQCVTSRDLQLLLRAYTRPSGPRVRWWACVARDTMIAMRSEREGPMRRQGHGWIRDADLSGG